MPDHPTPSGTPPASGIPAGSAGPGAAGAPGASGGPGAPPAAMVQAASGAPGGWGPGLGMAPDALDRWLEAEHAGLDDLAEAALTQLLQDLPRPLPRPGFAERVMAARGRPSLRGAWRAWAGTGGLRRPPRPSFGSLGVVGLGAAASAVVSAGLILAALAVLGVTAFGSRISSLVSGAVAAADRFGAWFADAVGLANQVLLLIKAVAEPLATPAVAALAAVCLLVSFLAARGLYDLIERDRRWVYADPI